MTEPDAKRLQSIDGFRGLAIVLMAVGNFAAMISWVPQELKHMPDIGISVADLVAPMFILAMALTTGPSMRRKAARLGKRGAIGKMILRCLSLIGIGAVISAGEAMNPPPDRILSWGVLQCLGASSLLLLLFIYAPGWVRLLAGITCLAIYQWLLDQFYLAVVLASAHNGLIGTLSWAGMLMIATAVADWFNHEDNPARRLIILLASGGLAGGIGFLLSAWFPISKNRASCTYMAVSLGICLLAFAVFYLLLDNKAGLLQWLQRIGRNPLALYLAHLIIIGLMMLPGREWIAGAPIWLSLLQAAAVLAALLGLSVIFERRGWIIRL